MPARLPWVWAGGLLTPAPSADSIPPTLILLHMKVYLFLFVLGKSHTVTQAGP